MESLTDVLEGNGNAWQTVTGIVDGFLQIYDGINKIVGIINMLRVATIAHTTAKAAESAAIGVATGAQTTEAVAAEANAVAQIPVIAANKLATASYMELAAALTSRPTPLYRLLVSVLLPDLLPPLQRWCKRIG